MSFLWNDHSPTHSKTTIKVKDGTKVDTGSVSKSLEDEDRPKVLLKPEDLKEPVVDKEPETRDTDEQPEEKQPEKEPNETKVIAKKSPKDLILKQPKSREDIVSTSKEADTMTVSTSEETATTKESKNKDTSEQVDEKPPTRSLPKVPDESAQATKRKLFESTHLEFDDFEEKQNSSGILKRVKRMDKSEVKVPNLRVANAITGSLSSSMFERESPTKPVSKRKHRSPDHTVNEKKCPKKAVETLSKEDSPVNPDLFISGVSQSASESHPILSDLSVDSVYDVSSPKPRVLEFSSFSTESLRQDPEDEVDRRLEFLDVEALEADRKRDQARADKFLAALDDIE